MDKAASPTKNHLHNAEKKTLIQTLVYDPLLENIEFNQPKKLDLNKIMTD